MSGLLRTPTAIEPVDDTQLSAGVATMPRLAIATSAASIGASGTLRLTYFTAPSRKYTSGVRIPCGATAAAATPTLVRFGLFTVDPATGDLTLVSSTANDTTLLATALNSYTKPFDVGHRFSAGARYAFGSLVVSAATMPTAFGNAAAIPQPEVNAAPRLVGAVTGQSDLPTSIPAGSVANGFQSIYAVLT